MIWRPPKEVVFGEGRTRRTCAVRVVTLAKFQREYRDHFGAGRAGRIPRALWCSDCNAMYLRRDRKGDAQRYDFLHELDHCYIDWRGAFYEP